MYEECELASSVSDQRLYQLRELHMRFHRRIAELCTCPQLLKAIEKNHLLTFNWFYDRFYSFGPQVLLLTALGCERCNRSEPAAFGRWFRYRLEYA